MSLDEEERDYDLDDLKDEYYEDWNDSPEVIDHKRENPHLYEDDEMVVDMFPNDEDGSEESEYIESLLD